MWLSDQLIPTPVAMFLALQEKWDDRFETDANDYFRLVDLVSDIQKIAIVKGPRDHAHIMFDMWVTKHTKKEFVTDADRKCIDQIFDISTIEVKGEAFKAITAILDKKSKANDRDKLEAAKVINMVLGGSEIPEPSELSEAGKKTLVVNIGNVPEVKNA
jgi:hypothetical protein